MISFCSFFFFFDVLMDRNKDLSVVLLSDPCEERPMQMQTVLGRIDVHSITEEVNCSKERGTYTK